MLYLVEERCRAVFDISFRFRLFDSSGRQKETRKGNLCQHQNFKSPFLSERSIDRMFILGGLIKASADGPAVMSSQRQAQRLACAKARRAANNRYQKLSKTLSKKLAKMSQHYDTKVYYIAYRNGRFHGFASADETGRLWSPPSQSSLLRSPYLVDND
jgi:hypothetical protein